MNEPSDKPSGFARRLPVFMSFVCPGIGQFMQKRWIAGSFYFIGFMIPFIYLPAYVLYHLFMNLKNVMSWDDVGGGQALQPVSFAKIGAAFLMALIFFIAGLLDTYLAEERKRKKLVEDAKSRGLAAAEPH